MAQIGKVRGARPVPAEARDANVQGPSKTVAANFTAAAAQAQRPRMVEHV
jgi:hypothetical protein